MARGVSFLTSHFLSYLARVRLSLIALILTGGSNVTTTTSRGACINFIISVSHGGWILSNLGAYLRDGVVAYANSVPFVGVRPA